MLYRLVRPGTGWHETRQAGTGWGTLLSMTEAPPRWLRIYANDLASGDLVRFTEDGDAVRVLDREHAPAWSLIFRVRLDGDATRGLAKSARVYVFDPDGSVARRVRVLPPDRPSPPSPASPPPLAP